VLALSPAAAQAAAEASGTEREWVR